MSSIEGCRISALLDAFDAAPDRFLSLSLDGLTVPELVELLERYALLKGRLDALRYELANPLVRSGKGVRRGGGRRA